MAASNDEVARAWFEACETGKGHAVCGQYQSDDATFECEGLPQIKLLSEYAGRRRAAACARVGLGARVSRCVGGGVGARSYTNWMKGICESTMPDARYTLHSVTHNDEHTEFVFFATYHGTHTGAGGPVEPTGKSFSSHYAYAVSFNEHGKVRGMIKLWNSYVAFQKLGWPHP